MKMHYLPLPQDVSEALLEQGITRLVCTLNGHDVRRAVQGRHDGERFILLGQALRRDLGLHLGDLVEVTIRPDPDPDRIELGEEFEAVLEEDQEAAARFFSFTPGRQRSLASYVTGAKRSETRVKRAYELAYKLRTFTLYGDLHGER